MSATLLRCYLPYAHSTISTFNDNYLLCMISVLYNDTYVFSLSVPIEFLRMFIIVSLDKNADVRRDGWKSVLPNSWRTHGAR